MKKRLLVMLIAVAMLMTAFSSFSFASETQTATFTFSASTPIEESGGLYTVDLQDKDVTLHIEDSCSLEYDEYLVLYGENSVVEITVPEGKKITKVLISLADSAGDFFGFQYTYSFNGTERCAFDPNDYIVKANGTIVTLELEQSSDAESYTPSESDTITTFTMGAQSSEYSPWITGMTVKYEDAEAKTVCVKEQTLNNGVTYAKTANGDVEALAGITNDGSVKCVYYNDGSATLYLNNVELTVNTADLGGQITFESIVTSTVSKINIVLTGDNKITTDAKLECIEGNNITISGTGSLNAYSAEDAGIYSNGYLTIDGAKCTVDTHTHSLIAANAENGDEGILNINGSAVIDAKSSNAEALFAEGKINLNMTSGGSVKTYGGMAAVIAFGNITLAESNVISIPENAVLTDNEGLHYVSTSAGGDYATEVVIKCIGSNQEEGKTSPKTGDSGNIAFFTVIAVLALAGAGIAYKRREN